MASEQQARLRSMLERVGATVATAKVRAALESRAAGRTGGPALENRRTSLESRYAQAGLEALDVVHRGGNLDADRRFVLEAIVMPLYRPVVDIVDDYIQVDQLPETWQELGDASRRDWTVKHIRAVGRINVPGTFYAGTGFVVGPDLLMTNRHVAAFFAQGLGTRVDFQSGQSASIGFYHEKGGAKSESLRIDKVVMIHPWWDMALLQVQGLGPDRPPLTLDTADPDTLQDRKVVVIGYPGYDPSDDQDFQRVQERIFRGTYYVKRFQPGVFRKRAEIQRYRRLNSAVTHDCSTLGGNSGSAVIDVESGRVVGLHFAGSYLEANYAVSPYDMAHDPKFAATLASAGVEFSGRMDPRGDFYGPVRAAWDAADRLDSTSAAEADPARDDATVAPHVPLDPPVPSPAPGSPTDASPSVTVKLSVPIRVSVSIGEPVLSWRNDAAPQPATTTEPNERRDRS